MEKDLLKLFLPEGLLDHFDIEKIEQGIENKDRHSQTVGFFKRNAWRRAPNP
ncbi:hypothetical protein [Natronogracilivirga saccharolytica]|uniref:Uncharacterized protein n=1 Tax=Natronogracilivirga saccharolytica TaxID=2812953 RepID=A0A8J7SCZ6_9BACT|nr:hypothetical protein [Natronogracilivirga saccharolytica]MBP3193781.1 hypothetical protein [Natronogracilivirga saccharolytica]